MRFRSRAGEAGKGFAVVAHEIRNLAGQCGLAVEKTNKVIQQTYEAINEGTNSTHELEDAFGYLAKTFTTVNDCTQQIQQGSEQQNVAIESVYNEMKEIADIISLNSATSQQSAAASEELSSQVDRLSDLVGKFRV